MPLLLSPARWIGGGDPQSGSYNNKQIRMAVSVFFFCQGLCFSSWASRIPDIKSALHLTDAALGSILLALPAGQLTAMPFSGKLVTHFGSKKVLRICLVLYAICLTNMGLATQPWHLALALYIFGVCGNMCNISVNTQAIAAEKLYGRPIMTSFHGAWSTAGFTGAAIGLLMVGQRISPYIHFWIVTSIVFIAIVFSQRYLQAGRSSVKQEKKKFFSKPNGVLVQLGIIGFCSMASEGAMFDWSGVYFKQVVEAPEQLIVLGYASFMIMMATGRFVGDKLILQFGRKKMLRISGIMISSGLFISVLFPYLATATLGFLIVGLGVSSIVPMVYSSAGKIPNIPPGIALASVSSISFLGFLMGPPLIGYIAEISSLRYSFAVIGLLGFGIAVMVSKLKAIH
ncbi:MFS transporter [Terrimonas sp. NA20]|uniref:MFS transporter n=1 Tax=Terrimonas ginsenosidimutans TaxID=2908004 RepID=A0ABS9KYA4_9BACT|nr:MFS transporter [Terrimonas ginsenosidimutans]MCG2617207.1 MFS transporter [Terrimonas ginsenosidimutans]